MRNPWGIERYHCDYSDQSDRWTPELKREAGATDVAKNDGLFFMTIEDYKSQGLATIVSFDTTNWYYDYFMMLDDRTNNPGSWSWCGETCTRHYIEVTSSMAQTVYVTAFTWEKRSYPDECQKSNKMHSIYMQGDFTVYTFKEGARQIKPIQFDAGETKSFTVEWDWARQDVTNDWSVTAWAEYGEITVSHHEGLQSDKLPFISRNNDDESQDGNTNMPDDDEPADELKMALTDIVTDFDISSRPGFCGFRLREIFDEDM